MNNHTKKVWEDCGKMGKNTETGQMEGNVFVHVPENSAALRTNSFLMEGTKSEIVEVGSGVTQGGRR